MTATDSPRGLPSRLHQVYEPHLLTAPDRIAFVEEGSAWACRQFADAVDAVALESLRAGSTGTISTHAPKGQAKSL